MEISTEQIIYVDFALFGFVTLWCEYLIHKEKHKLAESYNVCTFGSTAGGVSLRMNVLIPYPSKFVLLCPILL